MSKNVKQKDAVQEQVSDQNIDRADSSAGDGPEILVAKIATTESLSGLSTLEYHVGYEAGTTDQIHFRIWTNSGGGLFDRSWYSLASIIKALSKAEKHFNASALNPIAIGRSVNTPSFIGAALKAEGLLVRSEVVARSYERGNADMWWKSIYSLIEAGTNLEPTPIPKIVKKRKRAESAGKSETATVESAVA